MKIGIIAIVLMLLGASMVIYTSYREMQNEKTCPVTVMNKTVYVTRNATKNVTTPTKTLVFIYMSNCPYCEQMKPTIDNLIVKSYSDPKFNVLLVYTDDDPGAFARYNATSTPTIIILQNGKETARFGVCDEQTLINTLN